MQEERRHSFYGFHGAPERCAISIYENRIFNPGAPREDHWLGQGNYFFREDEEQAGLWATLKVKHHPDYINETPCVIEVVLEVDESMFLNLDSRKGLNQLKEFIDNLDKQHGIKINVDAQEGVPAKIRCFLLSLLPENIWMIQRTFRGKSAFDDMEIFAAMELELHGVQICARNNEVINTNSMKLKRLPKPIVRRGSKKPRLFNN